MVVAQHAAEPFAAGQKVSSAMPHKRNPILSENLTGLARLMRGYADAAMENVPLWHERDISHSSVERVILPDSFLALDHMLRRFTRIVKGMVVYPERMRENLERSRGIVFSGTVLLELAKRGVSREQAYEWVQRNAMRSFHEQRDFKQLLLDDADVILGRTVVHHIPLAEAWLGRLKTHLRPGTRFVVPCAGDGALIDVYVLHVGVVDRKSVV